MEKRKIIWYKINENDELILTRDVFDYMMSEIRLKNKYEEKINHLKNRISDYYEDVNKKDSLIKYIDEFIINSKKELSNIKEIDVNELMFYIAKICNHIEYMIRKEY